jgi:hypothetical protein
VGIKDSKISFFFKQIIIDNEKLDVENDEFNTRLLRGSIW